MGNFFNHVFEYNKILNAKKSSTLAGALVYFALLEMVPLAYLTTLTLSAFGSKIDNSFITDIFKDLKQVIDYVFTTAQKLGTSGNIIAVLISAYSATNFFYHLRRTGEIVYNYLEKNNVIVRVASLGIMTLFLFGFALFQGIYFFISKYSIEFFGTMLGSTINYSVLIFSFLVFVIMLNVYACPYKIRLKDVIVGSIYTCVFSIIMTVGFFIYINYFANFTEIYGAISAVVIFLMWLYIIMKGLISGMNLNVYYLGKRKKSRRQYALKRQLIKLN